MGRLSPPGTSNWNCAAKALDLVDLVLRYFQFRKRASAKGPLVPVFESSPLALVDPKETYSSHQLAMTPAFTHNFSNMRSIDLIA